MSHLRWLTVVKYTWRKPYAEVIDKNNWHKFLLNIEQIIQIYYVMIKRIFSKGTICDENRNDKL